MNIKLTDIIPQFSGSTNFSEWLQKFEMVAKIHKLEKLHEFLPLFLSDAAFQIYQGLDADVKLDYERVKSQLLKAFCPDPFQAYEEFQTRRLAEGELVDAYLADLNRLAMIFDANRPESIIKCAFVAGLPSNIKSKLRAACSLNEMTLPDVVSRTRILMRSSTGNSALIAEQRHNGNVSQQQHQTKVTCFRCGKEGHISRYCRREPNRHCYVCRANNHGASSCPSRVEPAKNE